ncbi:MAG: tRNA (5-methylaminomethyl-2-thiouridine)(34)-methyltransferase MnmD [Bacteroidota bacterium]|nr:tRNA (5-methylaminomethyl-2-thiouridine)(34)-methyltransferase MnmD [Bacteroidota bacterium]
MPDIKLIETEDGSHSIYLPELKETYHSFHGAIAESVYIYITQGFKRLLDKGKVAQVKKINILEVGFGTGLNILLTIEEAYNKHLSVEITTLEPYPLPSAIIQKLNYPKILGAKNPNFNYQEYFHQIHEAPWDVSARISEQIVLNKRKIKIQDFEEKEAIIDLVYFDAFAPSKQPEMWQPKIFDKLFKALTPEGILVTYCAQGQFKRNLKDAGFQVYTLQGPPGKKEMVRATKPN